MDGCINSSAILYVYHLPFFFFFPFSISFFPFLFPFSFFSFFFLPFFFFSYVIIYKSILNAYINLMYEFAMNWVVYYIWFI